MRTARWLRALAVIASTALVVTACGQDRSGSREQSETPVPGGRIVIGSISDARTMQPVIATDTASTERWQWVYLSLTRLNKDTGVTECNLCDKIELSSDGLTLTYTLKDNLVWSDGSPFTGEDYKFTAEATMRSKKTVRKDAFTNVVGAKDYETGKADNITGIQVTDGGKKIAIKFDKVFCPAIQRMGGAGAGGIIPKKYFGKYLVPSDASKNLDDAVENMAPPASMGPFVFKEFRPGDRATFTRNDKYFRGAPLAEELIVKVYADTTALKAALVTGEVTYGTVSAQDYEEVSKVEALKGYRFASLSYTYIGWNAKSAKAPWLASKDVRQALAHGIDADAILKKVVFGLGSRTLTHSTSVSWAHPDEKELNKYPFEQAKAKQLLEKAGAKMGPDGIYRWTNDAPMAMRIETNQGNLIREQIVQIAQEQYRAIGIKIDPLLESFPALLERTEPGTDYEGFVIGWSLAADPDPYSIWHSSQQGKGQFNNVGYSNPDVDKWILDARNGPDCSQAARKSNLAKVWKQLNDDVPYTFLYSGDTLLFANKRLQGIEPTTWTTSWNIEKWWFK